MSLAAHRWVAGVLDDPATTLSPTDRLLLGVLADWADNAGTCWPGTEAIARRMGVHYDTVGRSRKRVVAAGVLVYTPGGGADTGLYRLLIPAAMLSTTPASARRVKTSDPPRTRARPSAQARSTLRADADRTSNEPLYEPRVDDVVPAFTDAAGAREWSKLRK